MEFLISLLELIPGNKWVKTILFVVVSQSFTVFAAWIGIASPIQSQNIAVDIVFWVLLSFWCLVTLILAVKGHKRNWQEKKPSP